VVTAVDGAAEILRDDRHALLVPPSDPVAVGREVLKVLADPALGRRLVEAARPLLCEFDIDRMVRDQEALYTRLLAGAGAAVSPEEHLSEGAGRGARRRVV
jgi:glycosyltransferase involved in cell wall biosynthesis